MYLKKILWAISILGLVVASVFFMRIYNIMFSSNTAFEENEIYVFIPEEATYQEALPYITPHLKNPQSFEIFAIKRGYHQKVKGGTYRIYKDMNNHEIINVLTGVYRK